MMSSMPEDAAPQETPPDRRNHTPDDRQYTRPLHLRPSSPTESPAFIGFNAPLGRHVGRAFGIATLNILTLGLYKPYGITHTRRFLCAHTFIKGTPLAYHGTAKTLSRVTFYPSAAFLFLLVIPTVLQFYVPWTGILVLAGVQTLLLTIYAHFLVFYNKKYELSHTSWNRTYLTLTGSPFVYAKSSLISMALTALSLGLIAPWRRVMLSNMLYSSLFIGTHPVESTLTTRPLWPSYLAGWIGAFAGLIFGIWYYWHNAVLPVHTIISGGAPDLAMANRFGVSSLASGGAGGMGGSVPKETLAELATFLHALTLAFVLYPLWIIWKKFCFCFYEATFRTLWARHLHCAGASLSFSGTPAGIFMRDSLCFGLNFMTANLSRPFTTYIQQRFLCRTLVIQTPQKLLASLTAPPPEKRIQTTETHPAETRKNEKQARETGS